MDKENNNSTVYWVLRDADNEALVDMFNQLGKELHFRMNQVSATNPIEGEMDYDAISDKVLFVSEALEKRLQLFRRHKVVNDRTMENWRDRLQGLEGIQQMIDRMKVLDTKDRVGK